MKLSNCSVSINTFGFGVTHRPLLRVAPVAAEELDLGTVRRVRAGDVDALPAVPGDGSDDRGAGSGHGEPHHPHAGGQAHRDGGDDQPGPATASPEDSS